MDLGAIVNARRPRKAASQLDLKQIAESQWSSNAILTPPTACNASPVSDSNRVSWLASDEVLPQVDPRRFTPNLHANLVAEILTLRRDQEEKLRLIESLELLLETNQEENEKLNTVAAEASKETRALKKQLAVLEGQTSKALNGLTRERNDAVGSMSDARKRIDSLLQKIRLLETDSRRVHDNWAREKEEWDVEKRKLETKVHAAESRLKMAMDEFTSMQQSQERQQGERSIEAAEVGSGTTAPQSTAAASRPESESTVRTLSPLSTEFILSPSRLSNRDTLMNNGNTLADELNISGSFDYDDDNDSNDGNTDTYSDAPSNNEIDLSPKRVNGYASNHKEDRAWRLSSGLHRASNATDLQQTTYNLDTGRLSQQVVVKHDNGNSGRNRGVSTPRPIYVDCGVQYMSPSSSVASVITGIVSKSRVDKEVEARPWPSTTIAMASTQTEPDERVLPHPHVTPPITPGEKGEHPAMTHVSIQTDFEFQCTQIVLVPAFTQLDQPPVLPMNEEAPRLTLSNLVQVDYPPAPLVPSAGEGPPLLCSTSTQTDDPTPAGESRPCVPAAINLPTPIPTISIVPPSGRIIRFPQCKNAGCQTSAGESPSYKTMAAQTDSIRVALRLNRLHTPLRPSKNRSQSCLVGRECKAPADKFNTKDREKTAAYCREKVKLKSVGSDVPQTAVGSRESETRGIYSGNNDDGPLWQSKAPVRRPSRPGNMFASFDGNSSDEHDDYIDTVTQSEAEFQTALSVPFKPREVSLHPKATKRKSSAIVSPDERSKQVKRISRGSPTAFDKFHTTVSAGEELDLFDEEEAEWSDFERRRRALALFNDQTPTNPVQLVLPTLSKPEVSTSDAMLGAGDSASEQRALPLSDSPFSIPDRGSSRRMFSSPLSPCHLACSDTIRGEDEQNPLTKTLHKARLASAIPNYSQNDDTVVSSPPSTPADFLPDSSVCGEELMSGVAFTTPQYRYQRRFHDSSKTVPVKPLIATPGTMAPRPAVSPDSLDSHGSPVRSVTTPTNAFGVVDAISHTMVGEWMFKYVRRRKSFAMVDLGVKDETSNGRHKRWVWLTPYERSILWSSKQPTSGTALMGKAGRKLVIQSVLDVKDDNPPPRGVSQLFNRSILVLTPERALKFTACNAERHYLWITALSFLAHCPQAVPEIMPQPRSPADVTSLHSNTRQQKKRVAICDSIRLAKGRNDTVARPSTSGQQLQHEQQYQYKQDVQLSGSPTSSVPVTLSVPESSLNLNGVFVPSLSVHETAESPIVPRFGERVHEQLPIRKNTNSRGLRIPELPILRHNATSTGGIGSGNGSRVIAAIPSPVLTPTLSGRVLAAFGSGSPSPRGFLHARSSPTLTDDTKWDYSAGRQGAATSPSPPSSQRSGRLIFDGVSTVSMEAFVNPPTRSQRRAPYSRTYHSRSNSRESGDDLNSDFPIDNAASPLVLTGNGDWTTCRQLRAEQSQSARYVPLMRNRHTSR